MKKSLFNRTFASCLFCSVCLLPLNAAEFKTDFTPFHFASHPAKGTVADCSYLNTPITEKQRVSVGSDGHLYSDGKRLRIFGTNIAAFPPIEDAEYWAQTLASQGINCVRFHHTDSNWTDCFFKHDSNWNLYFDEEGFERFDRFFYELKKAGIYSNINLLTGREMNSSASPHLPKEIDKVSDWKDRHAYGFWSENGILDQKEYAQKILTHKNPYTGLTYAQDPAVIFVEINNENSFTKSYFDGTLERFPQSLTQELQQKWNDFLSVKNLDFATLDKLYNIHEPKGKNMISGKGLLEQYSGAKAELKETKDGTTIKVKSNGAESWHVQYDLYGFTTEANQMYTVSFKARASKNTSVTIGIMMNHDPWQDLGFSKEVKLSQDWQNFTFTASSLQADSKPRFTVGNMGLQSGTTFEFSDIQIYKGGEAINVKKDSSGLVLPSSFEFHSLPMNYRLLVTEFLYKVDSEYWQTMNDYVKNDLGVKALTFGTAITCAPDSVMNIFDVIDTHAYWHHPVFPHNSWDASDYFVQNQSLTTSENGGTLTEPAKKRVYGKPFSVTEYDHPYPNQFSSEMMPMLAVYASLQDWDCIYSFCYEITERNLEQTKITEYFDQAYNPAKISAMATAARIFREYRVEPLSTALYYPIDVQTEREVIASMGETWNVAPAEGFGISATDGLFYQVGSVIAESAEKADAEAKRLRSIKASKNIKFEPLSDYRTILDAKKYERQGGQTPADCDGKLWWNSKKGFFIYTDDDVFVSVTMPNVGKSATDEISKYTAQKSEISFTPAQDFAAVCGVKLAPNDWLLFSSSWSGNSGETIYEYGSVKKPSSKPALTRENVKLTTVQVGSGKLSLSLGAEGELQVPGTGWALYSLNSDGTPRQKEGSLHLSSHSGTLWYELKK